MMGHKICFYGEIWLICLNYLLQYYPFLSGALIQKWDCSLKSHLYDWMRGIKPGTPGLVVWGINHYTTATSVKFGF